jgi:uncharacterized membrane protein
MKFSCCDCGIVGKWCGSSGDFLKVAFKPGLGAPSEDPAMCTKWMVTGMWLLILAYLVGVGFHVVSGGNAVMAVVFWVLYAVICFLQTWSFWWAFIKREPSCCYLVCCCIEDWKPMHLIAGILIILGGVSQVYEVVTAFLTWMELQTEPDPLSMGVYVVNVVFMVLYAIVNVGTGVCLVKIGNKTASFEVPAGEKVGA